VGRITQMPKGRGPGKNMTNYKLMYISRETAAPKSITVQAATKTEAWDMIEGWDDFVKRIKNVQ